MGPVGMIKVRVIRISFWNTKWCPDKETTTIERNEVPIASELKSISKPTIANGKFSTAVDEPFGGLLEVPPNTVKSGFRKLRDLIDEVEIGKQYSPRDPVLATRSSEFETETTN
ncbi:hypothetical protein V6N13_032784 [Hibiscus sabdariffa]